MSGINFVSPGVQTPTASSGSSSVGTITITYSPVAGNYVVIGIATNTATTTITCTDNNSNALTLVSSSNPGNTVFTYLFEGIAQASATSYTVTLSPSRKCAAVLAEYSGGSSLSNLGVYATGGIYPATLTVSSLAVANGWVIGAVATVDGAITYTSVQGNVREQIALGSSTVAICIGDNTGPTAGNAVSFETTFSGVLNWDFVGFELDPLVATGYAGLITYIGP